jgi:predicted AlkP superfamily pyrophosphatase or phosphodiesterase
MLARPPEMTLMLWTRRAALSAVLAATGLIGHAHLAAQARPASRSAAARSTPALVVLVVVDQFRADYVQRYSHQWTKGLRRMIDSGAYFPLAAYPYSGTVTCAGHTTIGTGAFPRTHGMIGNGWYDRDAKRSTTCTQDADAMSVPFGGRSGVEHHSSKWLLANTFADELRAQSGAAAKVVSISLKARSAIGMAGHGGDLVLWEEDAATWATSSAFAKTARPDVDAYARAHVIDSQYGRVWDRLLPLDRYLYDDKGLAEQVPTGWTDSFPHAQTRPDGKVDQLFYDNWERTPFSDEALADMAIEFSRPLGQSAGTDMLAVSFSSLDLVGHRFGITSHEVQDVLARVDLQLGRLFDALDRRVGAGRYVVGLSSDHGVAPLPEQMSAMGLDAGRFTAGSVNARMLEAWKPFARDATSPIANSNGLDVYFTPAAATVLRANAEARQAITQAALGAPGIWRAYWADDLAGLTATDDPILRAARLSYVPGRSADLLLIAKPYWMTPTGGTTHGTPHGYDQRVPVMLMGFGITPGRYLTGATPADIAPTFAVLAGITLARADGRALTEALARTAPVIVR